MSPNVTRPASKDRRSLAWRRGEAKLERGVETERATPRPARFDDGVEAKTLEELRRRRTRGLGG